MQYIWEVEINKDSSYFSTEENALKYINKIGKIVKQNTRNKDNQKITCEANNNLVKIKLKKINIDEGI
jgi:hypothetical protein